MELCMAGQGHSVSEGWDSVFLFWLLVNSIWAFFFLTVKATTSCQPLPTLVFSLLSFKPFSFFSPVPTEEESMFFDDPAFFPALPSL